MLALLSRDISVVFVEWKHVTDLRREINSINNVYKPKI